MRIVAGILMFCASTTRALKAENGVYSADTLKLVRLAPYLHCSHTEHDDKSESSSKRTDILFEQATTFLSPKSPLRIGRIDVVPEVPC